MRTSENIYHRVRWDPRFDPARFVIGVRQRGATAKRIPLPAFVPGGDIPWHRVLFVEADGEVVWDRSTGLDIIDDCGVGRVLTPRFLGAPFFAARTAHWWDPQGGWVPLPPDSGLMGGMPQAPSGLDTSLRVVTWNTLWDRFDSDRIDTARRRPLLVEALEGCDADLIALQEVEAGLLEMLLDAPWIRSQYTLGADPASRDVDTYGLLVLSRLPVREAGLHQLGQRKAVAAVTVQTGSGPVVFATTHLTSDRSKRGSAGRQAELAQIAEGLSRVTVDVILSGDFNDGNCGPEGPAARLGFQDVWTEVRGVDDATPTFDPASNPLAAVSTLSGRATRLDRILLRATGLRASSAVLRGDTPGSEGLYASDHYAVCADLVRAVPEDPDDGRATGPVAGVDSPSTARTAVAWIPPQELRPAIEAIRREHDPQIHRWPPHVNVLFGFVPESDFDQAVEILAEEVTGVPAFPVRLGAIRTFQHQDTTTVWVDPETEATASWPLLHHALRRRFPGCRGRAEGYIPHLSLGRGKDAQRIVAACESRLGRMPAQVDEVVLLSRRGGEPMRPRATVRLGTGEVGWCDEDQDVHEPCPEPVSQRSTADEVVRCLAAAMDQGVVHVVGSRRMGCALPGADLDLVVALPGTVSMRGVLDRITPALPPGARIRPITGARVPGLRLRVGSLSVDLTVVATGAIAPTAAVERRTELDASAAVALSAVSDAEAILASVDGQAMACFERLAVQVKTWARVRGLDSAPFGGLPGMAWSILAARTVTGVHTGGTATGQVSPAMTSGDLLREFFGTWAAWDWNVPVMTPSAPVRSCTDQVGAGFRDLLTNEFYRAWEILEETATTGDDPWPRLLAPPALHRRHAAWAVLSLAAADDRTFDELLGSLRGRVLALLTTLEEDGCPDAHAWPHPFEVGPLSARYAIGLGRNPPDPARLTELVKRWRRGLPGLEVGWLECGAVPTLTAPIRSGEDRRAVAGWRHDSTPPSYPSGRRSDRDLPEGLR